MGRGNTIKIPNECLSLFTTEGSHIVDSMPVCYFAVQARLEAASNVSGMSTQVPPPRCLCSAEIADVVAALLVVDPAQRPTMPRVAELLAPRYVLIYTCPLGFYMWSVYYHKHCRDGATELFVV